MIRRRFLSSIVEKTTQTTPATAVLVRGSGLFGALGQGEKLHDLSSWNELELSLDSDDSPLKVRTGWGHSVMLTRKGNVFAWGRPYDFVNLLRLNRIERMSKFLARLSAKASNTSLFGDVFGYYPTPTTLSGLEPIEDVACSAGLTILRGASGQVYSFGYNRWEQCGVVSHKKDSVVQPTVIPDLLPCTQIETGLQHTLALTQDGQVYGWGKCNKGQLGIGNTEQLSSNPIKVPVSVEMKRISAGFGHSAAVGADGKVYVWGKGMSQAVEEKMGMIKVAGIAWTPRAIRLPQGRKAVDVCSSNFTLVITADDKSLWVIGMGEHDRNANPDPIPVVSDYRAADGSRRSVFECVELVRKGYQRVSLHCNTDFVLNTTTEDTAHEGGPVRDFEVICHKGEAYLRPLSWDVGSVSGEDERYSRRSVQLLDYSAGWKHELAIVNKIL